VTGYSLARTFRTIDSLVEECGDWEVRTVTAKLVELHERETKDERFFLLLNRVLFRAPKPERRWRVLRRFYGLEQGLVDRFHQGHLRPLDRWRLLLGKLPAVPFFRAVSCLLEAFTPPSSSSQSRIPEKAITLGGSG
jgi:lycopene beta-cyclase